MHWFSRYVKSLFVGISLTSISVSKVKFMELSWIFLDIRNIRNSNKLNFGICRKPKHTECYTKSNGYNLKLHQQSVFNSLIPLSIPLEQTQYTNKYGHTLHTAEVKYFDKQLIDKKIRTFKRLKHIKEITTPIYFR
jgi:hypothetical protein